MKHVVTTKVGNKKITLETGWLAKQASGAVLVTCGETVVLVTAVATDFIREGVDFLPLTIDYQEKAYATGCDDYLSKPIDEDELWDKVEKYTA